MSYGLYIGKNHTADGVAYLAGYGDEPSSHWLEVVERRTHPEGASVRVGVTQQADLPGVLSEIPQAPETARHIRVNYSYYKGTPAPLTNGGLNEHGVAVRDIWSPSRDELVAMTPKDQTGPNYSDLARIVLERAGSAAEGVRIMGELIARYGHSTYGGNSHIIADSTEAWVVVQFAGGQGLWAAERLGDDSIRASRPGYIEDIPIDEPGSPDFLYSPNLVDFAVSQGWFDPAGGEAFNVNRIYGDAKGRWDGVRWIEDEMAARAASRQDRHRGRHVGRQNGAADGGHGGLRTGRSPPRHGLSGAAHAMAHAGRRGRRPLRSGVHGRKRGAGGVPAAPLPHRRGGGALPGRPFCG